MIFTSWQYILFLPLVFLVTFSLSPRLRPLFLLTASYLFYMAWKPQYVLVIVALTLFDFFAAIWIEKSQRQSTKKLLWLSSLAANLGMLFTFKYLGFFTHELNSLLTFFQAPWSVPVVDLILPIGISFHTFQAISYTTDTYLGKQPAEKSLLQFALFIAWFPQMVAGPIERGSSLLPQLIRFQTPDAGGIRTALWLIIWGFFKKMVVADNLATIVDPYFQGISSYGAGTAWLAIYAFAFQIYCDFSAYTDIAKGSSQLFGVKLTDNFNDPYLSRSLPEFWKRWHISLSSWFFEYVYFPFVRYAPLQAAPWLGILLVFLLSGVWHGANWTFLIWGLVNGVFYVAYMVINRTFPLPDRGWGRQAMILLNFHVVCFCWIFFRSPTVHDAGLVLRQLVAIPKVGDFGILTPLHAFGAAGLLLMAIFQIVSFNPKEASWFKFTVVCLMVVVAMLFFSMPSGNSFIYFQF